MQAQRIKYSVIPSKFEEDLDKKSFASPAEYNLVPQTILRKLVRERWMSYFKGLRIRRYNGICLYVETPSFSSKTKLYKNR